MTRRFNTAGPCDPADDYMLPALQRLPEAPALIDQRKYFVVHAPRQTGKTTTLRALARELTRMGSYAALHFSCEEAEPVGNDRAAAANAILSEIRLSAQDRLPAELRPPAWPVEADDSTLLRGALRAWAQACPRPLVLFFDEIDAVRGQSLVSVLRQLCAGYPERRSGDFPWSVVLCGMRDVRDYRTLSADGPEPAGTASPFNIKVESLRLGNFTHDEVADLYGQHTAATGQPFAPGAAAHAHDLTAGQPWLVNALAREVIEKIGVPATQPITIEHLEQAKERLILERATHLDSLAARLAEPRVRRIIGPLIAGELLSGNEPYDDDLSYVRDLGLIAPDSPVRAANPIYREVIARVLSSNIQESVTAEPRSFVRADGTFDFPKFLGEFADWWIENGEFLLQGGYYHEAAPHLIMMGYLQRVVNGGGLVEREYAVGTGRVDLQVRWPHTAADGTAEVQREALEIKTWRPTKADPLQPGLRQLDRYLDRIRLGHGTLAIFDQRPKAAPIHERTTITTTTSPAGRTIALLRA